MKRFFFILTFLVFSSPSYALVQNGLVREQNSGKTAIGGVQIIFNDAVPTTSDDYGKFRLLFNTKKPGDFIFVNEITKNGYELVNKKELEILKTSNSDQLGQDIILAKAGKIEAAKKEYYNISDKALLSGFEKEKKSLQSQLQRLQISQTEYLDKFTTLQEQYDKQKQALDQLADKFARVNFDDVEPLYLEALELFKAGKILETQKKLEGADLLHRADQRIKERERIASAKSEIEQQDADNKKGTQQDILAIQLLVQTYLLEFNYDKAEALYDRLVLLDNTNLDILQETADFYQQIQRYEKATRLFNIIIAHPQVLDWQRANAYGHIGELSTTTGKLPDALQAFTNSRNIYTVLISNNYDKIFYRSNLAVSCGKLGETHSDLGNLDKALTFFDDETRLFKELYEAYPQNVSFKNGLAISYSKLGETHSALGNLDKALTFFEERSRLGKELYEAYPQNVSFKNGLAISYAKLGVFNRDKRGDATKARRHFEQAEALWAELVKSYPAYAEFQRNWSSIKADLNAL